MSKIRVGIFHSHPVDHEVPLFRALSKQENIDLTVFYFSDRGATGSISTFGLKDIPYGDSVLEGYSYQILKNYGMGKKWSRCAFINPEVFKIVSKKNLDVVILYGYSFASCWFVILAALLNKVPILFRGETESILARPKWKSYIRNFLLPKIYSKFDSFLSLGSASEIHYHENGVPSSHVTRVPQSIDQRFTNAKMDQIAISSIRQRFGFTEDTVIFIYIHKHRIEKRPLDIIKAFCELPPHLNVGLLMLSDGPLRREAEQYVNKYEIKRKVHFTGYVAFDELVNLMYASDVLVVTSEETIGTVLFQALACGLAILTSDRVLGWMDVVKPGENGLVFRSRWIDSLVIHLRILAENRTLVDKMKSHSKQLRSEFSIDKSVSGMLSALRKLEMQ